MSLILFIAIQIIYFCFCLFKKMQQQKNIPTYVQLGVTVLSLEGSSWSFTLKDIRQKFSFSWQRYTIKYIYIYIGTHRFFRSLSHVCLFFVCFFMMNDSIAMRHKYVCTDSHKHIITTIKCVFDLKRAFVTQHDFILFPPNTSVQQLYSCFWHTLAAKGLSITCSKHNDRLILILELPGFAFVSTDLQYESHTGNVTTLAGVKLVQDENVLVMWMCFPYFLPQQINAATCTASPRRRRMWSSCSGWSWTARVAHIKTPTACVCGGNVRWVIFGERLLMWKFVLN